MTIRRLDTNNPVDRALVESYWLNIEDEQVVDGMTVRDVVYFK